MQGNGTESKQQALSWLVSQLRWEEMLDVLRGHPHEDLAKAA